MKRLKFHPTIIGNQILDDRVLRVVTSEMLYKQSGWPAYAMALDMLINGDADEDFLTRFFHLDSDETSAEADVIQMQATMGIHCGDRAARAGSLEKLMPTLEEMANISRVLEGIPGYIDVPCAQWQIQPKERYEGDFQVAPRKPVLIIGNTWDGLTPLRSAHNVSSGFEGSAVLEVNGHGVSLLHDVTMSEVA